MDQSKRRFLKKKRPFHRPFPPFPPIPPGDQINYTKVDFISRFISQQGKILSRRVTKLTLKQQRSLTIAIKQARILSSIPFLNNKKLVQMKKIESDARTKRFRKKKKKK